MVKVILLLALWALPVHGNVAGRLHEVVIARQPTATVVEIACAGPCEYESYGLASPERLVIDFSGVSEELVTAVVPGNVYPVSRVRVAELRSRETAATRLIVDLETRAEAEIERVPEGLLVRFRIERMEKVPVQAVLDRQPVAPRVEIATPDWTRPARSEARSERIASSDEAKRATPTTTPVQIAARAPGPPPLPEAEPLPVAVDDVDVAAGLDIAGGSLLPHNEKIKEISMSLARRTHKKAFIAPQQIEPIGPYATRKTFDLAAALIHILYWVPPVSLTLFFIVLLMPKASREEE